MAPFWQISGPGNHVKRDWRDGKNAANAQIAETIFNALCIKYEDGTYSLDLILGLESSGASQILIPYHWRDRCRYLNWTSNDAFPASKFTSLSPIRVETPLRLQMLLEERQKVSKATKASKHKDTSKLNGRFWNCPPNPSRAAFEHGRCLWRIVQNEFQPQVYGLPEAHWKMNIVIFSLALNFWTPNGIHFTKELIDASLTKCTTDPNNAATGIGPTWYFVAKENKGLQNSFHTESAVIQETWDTKTLPQEEIGRQIQILLDAHSQAKDSPAPLILLVHDYPQIQKHLAALGSLTNREWVFGLTELLAFDKDYRQFKQKEYTSSSRQRSRSPRGPRSNPISLKREHSPVPQQTRSSVYVVDTMEMFKTMSESGVNLIRPVAVYNAIAGRDEHDTCCAGDDSHYILQSWKGMVQGPTIDEQRAFFRELECSACPAKNEVSDIQEADTEPPEAAKLYEVQQEVPVDRFNAASDTESDDEWYSITRAY